MKTQLLILLLVTTVLSTFAQNTWTGTVDDKWSDENNWSGTVPSSSDDVLIPSGFTVTLDTPADILSLEVEGNSILNVTETLTIANPSEFEDNVVVNWSSGDLSGPGTLLNSGTINLSFASFDLSGSVVLNNPGTINLNGTAKIIIGTDSVLNNSGTGIIDFKSNSTEITKTGSAPNVLNNFGTIKGTFSNPTDQGFIGCQLINSDGTIQIESGSLNLNVTTVNFMGATLNVSSGASLNINSPTTLSGTLTGNVFGDLNWNDDFIVATTAILNFGGDSILNNTGGDLIGGGTLNNQSIIRVNSGGLIISEATTLENNGELQLTSGGDIRLATDCSINNTSSGTINFQSNNSNIASQGVADDTRTLNNSGTIKAALSTTTDQSTISIKLSNNDGIIQVDNGTLSLSYTGTSLTDGTYNIAAPGTLEWLFPIEVSGTLSGDLSGALGWSSNLEVPTTAIFNFSGNGIIDWVSGNLEGGGTLTNENTIVKSTGGIKRINGTTTLNNNGTLRQTVGGSIGISTNSVLNNNAAGIIELQASTSGFSPFGVAPNTLNNLGLIQANTSTGSAVISAQVSNSGSIDVVQNGLNFSGTLTNNTSGIIKGSGTITLPSTASNFMNNGTISPGASPGTLSFINDYTSSATSTLEIELNGLTPSTEFDVIAINGDADFDGDIAVTLGFEASVNDEFVICTTATNGINTCNFPASKTVNYNGFDYNFDVSCRNNNEVILTVSNKTLGVEQLADDLASIHLYPNPAKDKISFSSERIQKIEIYDINGRQLLYKNSSTASISHLPKGVYIIKGITTNNLLVTKRVIKI